MHMNDIIISLSTAQGSGAIAIIRLSGEGCIQLTQQFFDNKALSSSHSHKVLFGRIHDENKVAIDECLVALFRSPKTYTGEDVIEISCHGSSYIISAILNLFLRSGARQAMGGEFTQRAYLNGRMDLTQAEAVAELVASDSMQSHQMALKQLRGGVSTKISELRKQLIEFGSLIELELDFSEEDVEFADRQRFKSLINELKTEVSGLLNSFRLGNAIKEGVSTVIAGNPNVGKSTLLNALLNDERAIVSKIPGTTRDTVEEVLNINGIKFRLVDTAGLRTTDDEIEKIGIEKTHSSLDKAQIILYVIDVSDHNNATLQRAISDLKAYSGHFFLLINKMDLFPSFDTSRFHNLVAADHLITLSAKNEMNIDHLKDTIYNCVVEDRDQLNQSVIMSTRHHSSLSKTLDCVNKISHGLESGLSTDLLALEVRYAMNHLGEITGEIHSDDILESIFSSFCIGK